MSSFEVVQELDDVFKIGRARDVEVRREKVSLRKIISTLSIHHASFFPHHLRPPAIPKRKEE